MRLLALRIVRLPGIAAEFSIDSLAPGVNILTGPNASGKSSVLRALRALLYADEAKGHGVVVEGEFEDQGTRLRAQRTGDTVRWQMAGEAIEAPELPERRFLSCYVISIEELSGPVAGDTEISRLIARELSGGYDVAAAREHPAFTPKKAGLSEKKALAAASQQLNRVRQRSADLHRQEQELDGLERRRREALLARQEVDDLTTARELIDRRRRVEQLDAQLAGFPDEMSLLRGDELERLDTGSRTQENLRSEIDELARTREAAERKLCNSGLADSKLHKDDLIEARSAVGELRSLEPEIERCLLAEAKAQAAAAEISIQLGMESPEQGMQSPPSPEDIAAAERSLEEKRRLDAVIGAAEARLAELSGEEDSRQPGLERLRQARRDLLGWLAAADRSSTRSLLAALLLLLGFAGFAVPWLSADASLETLAPFASGLESYWSLTAGLSFMAGLLLVVMPVGRKRAHRAAFGRSGVEGPDGWRREKVAERLDGLGEEIAAAEERVRELGEVERLKRSLRSLEAKREAEIESLSSLAGQFGFDALTLDASLPVWLRLVRDLESSRREAHHARGEAGRLEERWRKLQWPLNELLRRHGAEGFLERLPGQAGDNPPFERVAGRLEVLLGALERRLAQRDEALATIDRAERERRRLESELGRTSEEMVQLLSGVGLGTEDLMVARRELEERTGRLKDWTELEEDRRKCEWRVQECAVALAGREALELTEAGREEELSERLLERQRLAGEYDLLSDQISTVRERLRAAEEARALEKAVAAEQLARDELGERLDEALFAEAGRYLLDLVQTQHNQARRPEGLERAAEFFRRFTRNRYGLEFDAVEQRFRARENETGGLRSLDELSTGTRAQLLLAVRVAYAEQLERGRLALPLFLDEALTTADADRFSAVAESLRFLAADGRQIFYLSARPEDVTYWAGAGRELPKVVDIGQLRRLSAAAPAASLSLPERQPVPAPEGLSAEEYAELLAVPGVDPWAEPEAVHLFHLLRDDLQLLRSLLEMGVERLGSLESYLASSEVGLMATLEEERRLLLRCRAVRAWIAGWRIGRGRPVSSQSLVDSGAVSDKFMSRLDEFREKVGGDAKELVEGLRNRAVKGFQSAKIDDLEEWLSECGHLDVRPRLNHEELSRHVAESVARYAEKLERERETSPEATRVTSGGAASAGDTVVASGAPASYTHAAPLRQATLACEFMTIAVAAWRATR